MEAQKIERDELGLVLGINYVFNERGRVNWRKMVQPEYIVPNRARTDETDITKLDDSKLLIKLGGLKDLAQIRGYKRVVYKPITATPEFVSMSCNILWKANYETEFDEIEFEGTADAHPGNTEDFARAYLTAIAENRAFARCVRNFLKIDIVSQEEVSSKATENSFAPQKDLTHVLDALLIRKKIPFETLRAKLEEEGVANAQTFQSTDDIPKGLLFDVVMRLTKFKS